MYALVEILGKQYKAVEGETLQVDLLSLEEGSAYETEKVLAVVDGDKAVFGTPYVAGAKVTATVGSEVKGGNVKGFYEVTVTDVDDGVSPTVEVNEDTSLTITDSEGTKNTGPFRIQSVFRSFPQ